MEEGLKRCQVHNKTSDKFCKTCKRMICEECEECTRHRKQDVGDFMKRHSFPPPDLLEFHKASAKRVSDRYKAKITQNDTEICCSKMVLNEINSLAAQSKEGQEEDLNLVVDAAYYLKDIKHRAFTVALKEAAKAAIRALDVGGQIRDEIAKYILGSNAYEKKIAKLEEKKKKIEQRLEWLNTIKEARVYELEYRTDYRMDCEVKLALSLCFANSIISPVEVSQDIYDFKAFPFVKKAFDIERVEQKKLIDIGGGVKISEPVYVLNNLRSEGEYFCASVSHNGIMAIRSYGPKSKQSRGTEGNRTIQFTNLRTGRQVEMALNDISLIGFYNKSIIMLAFKQPLREATVKSVFANPTRKVFKKMGDVDKVGSFTDVSLLQTTRVLYYRDIDYIPYEYNVDTHTNTKLEIGRKVSSFASMTGIDVGIKAIFQEHGGNKCTFALNKNNSITQIGKKQFGCLRNFIPSSTCPSDIEDGMLKYNDYLIFNKMKARPTKPMIFEPNQSLVRLYRDVFFTYNWEHHCWVLIRIVVP